MGDGSVTEGEVSEAFQFAVLKQLPIIYLVQDNGWSISAKAAEFRSMNAYEYAAGFKGMERIQCDGSDFAASYAAMHRAFDIARKERKPVLVHAQLPLLGHHTSGVRKEYYRSGQNLIEHAKQDPIPKLRQVLLQAGVSENDMKRIDEAVSKRLPSFTCVRT